MSEMDGLRLNSNQRSRGSYRFESR